MIAWWETNIVLLIKFAIVRRSYEGSAMSYDHIWSRTTSYDPRWSRTTSYDPRWSRTTSRTTIAQISYYVPRRRTMSCDVVRHRAIILRYPTLTRSFWTWPKTAKTSWDWPRWLRRRATSHDSRPMVRDHPTITHRKGSYDVLMVHCNHQHCGKGVRCLLFILWGDVLQRRVTSYDLAILSYDTLQCLESQPGF